MTWLCKSLLEAGTPLEQKFTLEKKLIVTNFKMYLEIHGTFVGNLRINLKINSLTVFTKTITAASINAAKTNTYTYGWWDFSPSEKMVLMNGEYTIELEGINSYNELNTPCYWISEYENRIDSGSYRPPWSCPHSFRLIGYWS